MVILSSLSICCENINRSILLLLTQFIFDLLFFLNSFSLTVFIKIFLIEKSIPSTNLNHKEGNQEEATIDQSTKISDSWRKIFRM